MAGYKELKNLRNRVVVITGASGGLGEQLAYQAAGKGAIVVACARRLDKLQEVVANCRQISGRLAFAYTLDVSDPNQIERVLAEVETNVGPIDVLINNAGFGLMENLLQIDEQTIESMFRVNVLGLIYLSKYTALRMAKRHRGAIINIASMAGKIATPKSTIYSATKFAVLGFSNALRLELKPLWIMVTTVNPGPIATAFFEKADKTGNYLKSIDKIVLQPEMVAKKVIRTIGTNKREVNLPYSMEIASHLYNAFPTLGDYLAGGILNKK